MSKQFSNLVVILFSAFLISACGSSSSSSGSGTVDNVVNDVVDDIANNDTDDNDSDNIDTDSPFVFDPFAQFPDITYTTLDQLPPLVERLNGGPSINPHTIGPVIGSGTYSNANLFRDIPFTIEGEVTEGLVIEKLYAVRNYIVSFLDIDGNKLPNDGFRSDQPEPKIFAIITKLQVRNLPGLIQTITDGIAYLREAQYRHTSTPKLINFPNSMRLIDMPMWRTSNPLISPP